MNAFECVLMFEKSSPALHILYANTFPFNHDEVRVSDDCMQDTSVFSTVFLLIQHVQFYNTQTHSQMHTHSHSYTLDIGINTHNEWW